MWQIHTPLIKDHFIIPYPLKRNFTHTILMFSVIVIRETWPWQEVLLEKNRQIIFPSLQGDSLESSSRLWGRTRKWEVQERSQSLMIFFLPAHLFLLWPFPSLVLGSIWKCICPPALVFMLSVGEAGISTTTLSSGREFSLRKFSWTG